MQSAAGELTASDTNKLHTLLWTLLSQGFSNREIPEPFSGTHIPVGAVALNHL